jgi:exonuclease VII small subunit
MNAAANQAQTAAVNELRAMQSRMTREDAVKLDSSINWLLTGFELAAHIRAKLNQN